MGACGSKPKGCVGVRNRLNLKNKRKRHRNRMRRVKKNQSLSHKNRVEPSNQRDVSCSNPAFQGNTEAWFDTDASIDSDCDDEFYSVQDDISQAGSISSAVTPRFSNHVISNDFQRNVDGPQNEPKNVDEIGGREEAGNLHSCSCLSNAFLPCLTCDELCDGKRKAVTIAGPSTRKKLSIASSFKWRDGNTNSVLSSAKTIVQRPIAGISASAKTIVQRPIAGSQIMSSPLEKKMPESWSYVDPSKFKVRGRNFNRDKKKEFAANYAAYVPFGVDVFLSPRKINHIAQYVEIPSFDSSGEIPSILLVNLQIPLYPAALFQSEYDGAGMNFVFYFKISENYSNDLPPHFQENIRRIIANATEKIKGFPLDNSAPFRERLKILGRVVNSEDLQLNAAERKLMNAYNEKPVLTRPQHEFYLGENYLEIDLDIHRFSYIARKGFETFQDRIKHCVFDFGLTIQGNKAEDLPECMLCCVRLKEINYSNYCQLSV